jgi:molybdopterin molybdotransferase
MTAPLSAHEAAHQILDAVAMQTIVSVPLDDALDLVLAERVVSPIQIPFRTNSAMDGYATRADDVRGASADTPVRLEVIETLPAGVVPTRALGAGQCARIFTGAPLPEGADGVIRQEDTDLGADVVTITTDRDAGANFRLAGEDVEVGDQVLSAGMPLGAAELGVLSMLAIARPLVHRRPRVAILGSGDELADVDDAEAILSGRKIASSNSHTLMALVRQAGAEPVSLGIARDTPESLRTHLAQAFDCDLLVTSAGISVGDHDYVRAVLTSLGAEQRFWKLRMRPGAPVAFGMLGSVPWIGLPGNPVSTMVTFELFVRPAIRKMLGHRTPFRQAVQVMLTEPISLKPRLQHFLRAIVTAGPRGHEARLTGPQGSGILTSMVKANALLVIPEGQHETPAGTMVQAILLTDPNHVATAPF